VTALSLPPWPEADPSVLAPVAEHEDLRKVMRDILQAHAGRDAVRQSADSETGYSRELWGLLNEEMSVSAMAVPEDRGGLGFGLGFLSVVLEEAGRAVAPEPIFSAAVLGAQALLAGDTGSLSEELVSGVLRGDLTVTAAVGDRCDHQVTATEEGVDSRLSGVVGRVLQGDAADLLVVPASGVRGRALYCVDLRAAGVSRTTPEVLDLTRRQARVELDGVPAQVVVAPPATDAALARLGVLSVVALAAEHTGMIEALLEMTRTYTLQRHQFDRPLASFQVVKHRLADMLVALERARSAARYAAAAFDADPESARLPAAVAGAVCTDAVIRAASDTVQLHGGVGFTWEHPAHLYLRRALGNEAAQGDARSHRAEVARLLAL
jgi:alkylation response protein AidB-like acyl-CoA dehydrogenase